ncbi:MAG: amidohydrolase family protein, partial [Betaproteobacteria bacterium]
MRNILRTFTLVAASFVASGVLAANSINIPSQVTLFKNVKIFDGKTNKLHSGLDVLVVKNKIHKIDRNIPTTGTWEIDVTTGGVEEVQGSIGGTDTYTFTIFSEGKSEKKQAKVNIIDGGGRTLMPGLIDAHVHLNMQLVGHGTDRGIQGTNLMTWEELGALAYESAREFLPAGVTTVRDLCGASSGLRKHIDSGALDGPRIYLSGACISQSSGHGDWRWDPDVLDPHRRNKSNIEKLGMTRLADGADEVLSAARNNMAGGSDFVKMMSGGGVTSERDPIESIQGTMAELKAMVTATSQFGTIGAVHAYHDISVQNAIRAGVKSIEHGNLMADPKTFQMVAEADAWIVPAMGAFADEIFEHPYYGNPDLPAYHKVKKIITNAENWIKLANKYKVNLGFGSDVVVVTKPVWRSSRDFQITQWGRAFGNFRTLKAMTSDNGRLMALTGV